jgi:hypothetical protein
MATCKGKWMADGKWNGDLAVSVTAVTVGLQKWHLGTLQGEGDL